MYVFVSAMSIALMVSKESLANQNVFLGTNLRNFDGTSAELNKLLW